MTRVKICGIRQLDHALVAAEAGADYIGLVFVPGRRRRMEVEAAREIVSMTQAIGSTLEGSNMPGSTAPASNIPQVVGLFADQPVAEVNQVVKGCGLDLVQLCGQESLDYCQQVEAQVIKVLHVPIYADSVRPELVEGQGDSRGPTGSASASLAYTDLVGGLGQAVQAHTKVDHLVTLDRLVDDLQGGTGQSFDWTIAAQLSQQGHEFLLAGGLDPDNVAQAVIEVNPWGVDVSSGVETDGVKDPDKIREFVRNVRRVRG